MKIRSIWFDLDDTLIPSEPTYATGLRSAWVRFRQTKTISWSQFQLRYAKARRDVKTQLGSSPSARNRLLYLNRLIVDVLGHTHPKLTQAMYEAYNSHWRNLKIKPIQNLLQRLAKTYRLAIATNQTIEFQLTKMRVLDPSGVYFSHLLTSEEAGYEKPHPQFFRYALKQSGLHPKEILMVGNSWDHDVLGARRAGIRPVFFLPKNSRLPLGHPIQRIPVIHTLEALEPLLSQIGRLKP